MLPIRFTTIRRVRRPMLKSVPALLMMVVLAGCAAVHRPATSIPALLSDANASRIAERQLRDTVIARLARRAIARPDHAVDVLMLSGGGQNGSYGVGFMRGWRARNAEPMPKFDLITAISTGALQAPFVLLGTPASHDTLALLYRDAADRIAPSFDWLFWLRKTGGVVNMKRFDANLKNTVSGALRDSLQRAFREDRQVVFGTTDLDIATGRSWDLSTVMQGGVDGLERTRTLLKAASAIPGIFPQVVYDGHVHSDGGVVSNILTLLTLDDYKAMLAQVRAAGVTAPVKINLYVIVNGWTHAAPVVMNPASRRQINRRWSNLSFFMHQPQVLEGLEYLAAAASAVPGLAMQMKWTAIPSELALDPAASSLFDKRWMQRLDELGERRARGATPWDTLVSPYMRPAVITP